jgi:hypothetical protein
MKDALPMGTPSLSASMAKQRLEQVIQQIEPPAIEGKRFSAKSLGILNIVTTFAGTK